MFFVFRLLASLFLSSLVVWLMADRDLARQGLPTVLASQPELWVPLIGFALLLMASFSLFSRPARSKESLRFDPEASAPVEQSTQPLGPADPVSAEAERFVLEDYIGYGL